MSNYSIYRFLCLRMSAFVSCTLSCISVYVRTLTRVRVRFRAVHVMLPFVGVRLCNRSLSACVSGVGVRSPCWRAFDPATNKDWCRRVDTRTGSR